MSSHASHTKVLLLVELVLLALLIGYICLYKVPRPSPPGPPVHLLPPAEAAETRKGIVQSYGSNREGDIDKLVLETGEHAYPLHFPPHTAAQVMQHAPVGATITVRVTGRKEPAARDAEQLELAGIEDGRGATVLDIRHLAPPTPGGEKTVVTGPPGGFRRDDRGEITSFVVDGSLITLAPPIRPSLGPLLAPAKNITVRGYWRGKGSGFVNNSGLRVVRPYEIEIDGVNYLVR